MWDLGFLTIGYAPTSGIIYPATDRPEDIEAARKAYFSMPEEDSNWTWNVAWWSDPVLLGHYPEEGLVRYEKYLLRMTEADMRLISEPIDVYGQNIYNGRAFRMGADGNSEEAVRGPGYAKTAVEEVLNGKDETDTPYEWWGGCAVAHPYGVEPRKIVYR